MWLEAREMAHQDTETSDGSRSLRTHGDEPEGSQIRQLAVNHTSPEHLQKLIGIHCDRCQNELQSALWNRGLRPPFRHDDVVAGQSESVPIPAALIASNKASRSAT